MENPLHLGSGVHIRKRMQMANHITNYHIINIHLSTHLLYELCNRGFVKINCKCHQLSAIACLRCCAMWTSTRVLTLPKSSKRSVINIIRVLIIYCIHIHKIDIYKRCIKLPRFVLSPYEVWTLVKTDIAAAKLLMTISFSEAFSTNKVITQLSPSNVK